MTILVGSKHLACLVCLACQPIMAGLGPKRSLIAWRLSVDTKVGHIPFDNSIGLVKADWALVISLSPVDLDAIPMRRNAGWQSARLFSM